MRILYFSRDYTTHDHRFLTGLANTSHKVYFLRLEKGLHVLEDRPLPPEIELVQWVGGIQTVKLKDGFRLLNDLHRVIRQVKPDLIQAGPIQRSAFLVALTGFHPLVSMSWGYDLLHDVNINLFWRWATRYTLQHSDAMVGDCNTIRQLAISYGMPDYRIVTFPWGVDINHFNLPTFNHSNVLLLEPPNVQSLQPSSLPTFKPSNVQRLESPSIQTFSLLSTRGFEPIYGIDVIAKAFVIAARKRPELHLTMLGNGSQAAAIRQIFLIGAVSDRVHFPGQVAYDDLPSYYQNADVYLSASHSDGTSISLLEAFACGTPAIVSDIPGNQEWVTPGENGWLFPDGNAEALASVILNAMDQRQILPEMGHKARLLAEAHANWEKNFPMLMTAYQLVI
jgi:glycosyltransferase involved in cell wall biosynthesis